MGPLAEPELSLV